MRVRSLAHFTLLFLLATQIATVLRAATWAHEKSDLRPDPAVVYGSLENGFRYAILPNTNPPDQLSIRLIVDVGSIHETTKERGYAHFVEHMAFNGTRSFPEPQELLQQLQRMGVGFGAHANAFTSYTDTIYLLDFPAATDEALTLGLQVMRDVSDGILFRKKEVTQEKGVILSEKREVTGVEHELVQKRLEFLIPDSIIAERHPLGTERVVRRAKPETLRAFYDRHYTADNMILVVAGEVSPAALEPQIAKAFASLRETSDERAPLEIDTKFPDLGFRAQVFAHAESPASFLSVTSPRPADRSPDRIEKRIQSLDLDLANHALTQRFQVLAKEQNSPIMDGAALRENIGNIVEMDIVGVSPVYGESSRFITLLENEFRRALDHGFTPNEIEKNKRNLLRFMEHTVDQAAARPTSQLATELAYTLNAGVVFTHPSEDLRITRIGLENVTHESCHRAFSSNWEDRSMNLIFQNASSGWNAKRQLESIFQASSHIPVEAPEEEPLVEFAYTDFGTPGEIVESEQIDNPALTKLRFDNNVRVNLMPTAFAEDHVLILARFGNGLLTLPQDQPGLDTLAEFIVNNGGLGQHSNDEILSALTGRFGSSTFGIESDAFLIYGASTASDLLTTLQLMCAMLTDPGYREEAMWQFTQVLPILENNQEKTMSGAISAFSQWIHGNDPRFARFDSERVAGYGVADVKKWLEPQFERTHLEIGIVGDFEENLIVEKLAQTFGAIPDRPAANHVPLELTRLDQPDLPSHHDYEYDSREKMAAVVTAWRVPTAKEDKSTNRRLNLLAQIIADRMREELREEMGVSYAPSAEIFNDNTFQLAYLTTHAICDPRNSKKLIRRISAIAEEIAAEGITPDELERAQKPLLSQLKQARHSNDYWLWSGVSTAQGKPYRLDWLREEEADYSAISHSELSQLAADFLKPENFLSVAISPERGKKGGKLGLGIFGR